MITLNDIQRGYEAWAAKPHNAKWVRKIDGTPIPNDIPVSIFMYLKESGLLDQSAPSVAVKALEFYANPKNWIDTPSWDGDPVCISDKAIPVDRSQEGSPCDCGDIARAALSTLSAAGPAPSVAVKALKWSIAGTKSSVSGGPHDTAWAWDAKGVGLGYRIITQPEANKPYLLLLFDNYATLEEAKAAAQADYDARIRSALSEQVQDDCMPIPQNKETLDQVASIMLQHGTPAQRAEAIAYAAQVQDVEITTPSLAQLRLAIDKAEFWKGVTDADDYNVAADHVVTEIVNLILATAPVKQEG